MSKVSDGAKRASVYEVAALAGTSIATVSRALNQPHRVSAETRTKVLAAVAELNYVVDVEASARARSNKHMRIAVVSPEHTFPGFSARLKGMIQTFEKFEGEVIVFHVDIDKLQEKNQFKYFDSLAASGRYDALIIISLPLQDQFMERLISTGFPTVLLEIQDSRFASVQVDHIYGSEVATQHLIDQGHRAIGFLGFVNMNNYSLDASAMRETGFRKTLELNKIEVREEFIYHTNYGIDPAYETIKSAWKNGSKPDAIVCATDLAALGVMKAAKEFGMQIPQDLAVVGFDDIDMASYVELTTIRQPLEDTGVVAAELVISLLEKEKVSTKKVLLDLELVVRSTT